MTPGRTCATCAAFAALAKQCRANPPTAFVMPQASGQLAILGVYPQTNKDEWCLGWVAGKPALEN